jgi:hypothetical protein
MTDIEQKALALVREVLAERNLSDKRVVRREVSPYTEALCRAIEQHEALREALVDLLHAVCGEKGFAEAVRRDSGRIYPWPALELAEAKALAALGQSK